jgi:hypothetical protein
MPYTVYLYKAGLHVILIQGMESICVFGYPCRPLPMVWDHVWLEHITATKRPDCREADNGASGFIIK